MMDTPKSYQLLFEERPGYLYALIRSDTMTYDTAHKYVTEIAEKCTELDCTRLLFERDVPVILPVTDLFAVTKYFLELMQGKRVAFVNRHAPLTKTLEIGMLIGNNRGALFQLFNNVEDAEKWLLES